MNKELFQYIDGEMNEDERKAFEIKLSKDEALRSEYEKYQEINKNLKADNVELDDNYYAEVITKFRSGSKTEKRKTGLVPKLAYAALAIVFILTSTLIFNNLSDSPKLNDITEQMSTEELNNTLSAYYGNDITEEEMYSVETELNKNLAENILVDPSDSSSYDLIADANYSSILNNINDEEADIIYKELINKQFLGD